MVVTIACINRLRSQQVTIRVCDISTDLDSFKARQQNESVSLGPISFSLTSSSLMSQPSGASEQSTSCTTSQTFEQIEDTLLSNASHCSSDASSDSL